MFSRFFSKATQNDLDLLVTESPEEDFLCIDVLDDLSEKDEEAKIQSCITESTFMPPPLAILDKNEETHPCIPASSTLENEKSHRRLHWETRNKKVFGTMQDETGRVIEIRRVNQGKQLAFWDDAKNAQVYLPQKISSQALEKPRVF